MKCRCCESTDTSEVFSLPPIPLVGEFTKFENPHAEKFPITLFFCNSCSVLLIKETIDANKLFNEYSFSSSTVKSLVEHFNEFASWLVQTYSPQAILEVGCNDGILLGPLTDLGVESYGVDISRNISEIANSKGHNVKNFKFNLKNTETIKFWMHRKVDIITASNTFPHNEDPNDFLSAAKELLTDSGRVIFEVMYSGSMATNLQWDTIYHEHLHFHSLLSISNLFNRNGFFLEHAEIVPMHAGSLRVVGSLMKVSPSAKALEILNSEMETKLNTKTQWLKFSSDVFKSIEICKKNLVEIHKVGSLAAYGASGRATMWISLLKLDFIQFVVDGSPLRSGHYMPGSQIPIVSPEHFENNPPDATFVTAWNYFDGIMSQHPNYSGMWISPLPKYAEVRKIK